MKVLLNAQMAVMFFALLVSASPAQVFYPLKVGNRWDYSFSQWNFPPRDTTYSYSVLVTGQRILPNGKTYFELSRNDLTNYGRFVRVDSNCVYYYNQSDSTEFLVYKFSAHLHDYWQIGPSSARGARLSDTGSRQVFGRLSNSLTFTLGNLVFNQVTFSDRFGPVEFASNGEPPGTSSTSITILGCLISDSLFGKLTSVFQSPSSGPTQIQLCQNYPNPFNPSTIISYGLPMASRVTVRVFNALGQEVALLVDEEKQAGSYQVRWTANVPSGVYFYRIQTAQYSDCKKMVVLR